MKVSLPVRLPVACLVAVLLVSCSSDASESPTTQQSSTTTVPGPVETSTTVAVESTTSTTSQAGVDGWVLHPTLEQMPEPWVQSFVIGYGEDDALLGSAPGGEGLTLGPDYGAQAPDGSWWFLDAAKRRFAHYDPSGVYLEEVRLPEQYLANGQYFQFQLPHILADGTLVATRFGSDSTSILRMSEGVVTVGSASGAFLLKADDGVDLYGLDLDGGMKKVGENDEIEEVEWFQTQTGARYSLVLTSEGVVIELPDAGQTLEIPLSAGNGPGAVHAMVELGTGADGSIHVLLIGISESDETEQLGGYAVISPDGSVGEMEPVLDPFTPADPGSPSHFGVAFGSSQPWFMVIGESGVEVYTRG